MFSNGDRVRLTYWRERLGTVVAAGAEQSGVKFDDDGLTLNHMNEHLEKAPGTSRQPNKVTQVTQATKRGGGRSKLTDNLIWKSTEMKLNFKPGSKYHTQAIIARSTLNMPAFKAGGGELNYLSWLFRKGYIIRV